jgi:hypothetical protein
LPSAGDIGGNLFKKRSLGSYGRLPSSGASCKPVNTQGEKSTKKIYTKYIMIKKKIYIGREGGPQYNNFEEIKINWKRSIVDG